MGEDVSNARSDANRLGGHEGVRRAVVAASLIGYGLAAAGFTLRITAGEQSLSAELPGAVVLAFVVATPSILGVLSMKRRPMMLLPAGVIAVAGVLGFLSILGFLMAISGLLLLWGYLKLMPSGHFARKFAMAVVPLLWVGAAAALFIHIDPLCEQHLRDGSVVEVDATDRGYETGWLWDVNTTTFTGSGSGSDQIVYESCTSDVVVPWEMWASLAMVGSAIALGWRLAGVEHDQALDVADDLSPV